MSNLPYKNPISPLQSLGSQSVTRTDTFGTNFSVLGTGGFMEVYNLTDLNYTLPVGQTGTIEFSGNTIPIQFKKGTGSVFSPDVLTLNSDNISSGRRRLGMLVYVYETKTIYQHTIDNYDNLWSAATAASGPGGATVVISDFGTTIKNNTVAGQNLINAWTGSTIEGVSGATSSNATWRVLQVRASNSGDTFVTGFTYNNSQITLSQNRTDQYSGFTITLTGLTGSSVSGNYLPLSGGTVSGNTTFLSGLTATTISATTYQNLPVTADTFVTGFSLTSNTITLSQNRTDQYSAFTISLSAYTGNTSVSGEYLPLSGGTVSGDTVFQSGLTATTISATTYFNLPVTLYTGDGDLLSDRVVNLSSYSLNFSSFTNPDTLVMSGGNVGVGTSTPKTLLQVGDGGGDMLYPYEQLVVERSSDTKLSVFTSAIDPVSNGSSVVIGYSKFLTNSGYFPAFEFQHLGNIVDEENYVRYNYIQRNNPSGVVASAATNLFNIYAEGSVIINSPTSNSRLGVGVNKSAITNTLHISASTEPVRFEGLSSSTSDSLVVSVDNSGVLHTYPISQLTGGTGPTVSGEYLPLSGGTVSGNTTFLSGLTATTISATTYQNLPVTADTFVTGFSLNNNTITLSQNRTGQYSGFSISLSAYTGNTSVLGDYLPISGGTVTGNTIFTSGLTANTLNVTGNTRLVGLTATTISATTYFNLPVTADTFVTGFSLNNNVITLSQNRTDQYSGFSVSLSAYTGNTSTSGNFLPLSGGSVTGNTTFTSGLTANTFNVTGNTRLNGLTASTISATTYQNLPVTADTFVTGLTLTNNNLLTLSQNRLDSYSSFTISLSAVTGTSYNISGLTANTIFTDYIDFNTNISVASQVGRLRYDSGEGGLVQTLKGGNVDLQIGQQNVVYCFNADTITLNKGTVVYISGGQGNRPAVKRAIASAETTSSTALGVVSETIASGAEGFITTFGNVKNFQLTGITPGSYVYLSPTTSGEFTGTQPQAPQHIVAIGYVVRTGNTQGEIFVNINNGWELNELHNVRITNAQQNDILQYSASTSVWYNTSSPTFNSITVTGNTSLQTATATTIVSTYINNFVLRDTTGVVSVDTSQRKLTGSNGSSVKFDWENMTFNSLTNNGFLKVSGGTGNIYVDTTTYLSSAVTATTLSSANVLSVTSDGGSATTSTINAVTGGSFNSVSGIITLSGTGNVNGTQITGFTGGSGEVNTASNLGSGTGLFAQKSGVDLQFKSLTSTGGTVTITNNSTTVNLESSSTGGGISWNSATTTQSMTADNGYVTTAATLTTFTLPSSIAFGKTVEIAGNSTGLWQLNQNSGQQIRFGNTATTVTSGILSATSQGDCIKLICTSTNTSFIVTSSMGNIFFS